MIDSTDLLLINDTNNKNNFDLNVKEFKKIYNQYYYSKYNIFPSKELTEYDIIDLPLLNIKISNSTIIIPLKKSINYKENINNTQQEIDIKEFKKLYKKYCFSKYIPPKVLSKL
jgi:hypothetical protein